MIGLGTILINSLLSRHFIVYLTRLCKKNMKKHSYPPSSSANEGNLLSLHYLEESIIRPWLKINYRDMEIENLISECTAYDFKLMLEEKRPKSWLKSISAFANGLGGSLFLGVSNDGIVQGLDGIQHVCETISSKIRDYIDPLPEVEMIPLRINELDVLQLKVHCGNYTPYYYVCDGQRIAFVRVGDESIPATAEQMVRLVLKGSNKTFDSLHTNYNVKDNSFSILANSFKQRTGQEWNKKYLLSFGLVTNEGHLTNAGALFADDCNLSQSRLYCTRWNGIEKDDAINDAEFKGNILLLLRESMNFVKANTRKGWEKLPNGRKNKPEYAERAVLEALVNHFYPSRLYCNGWRSPS